MWRACSLIKQWKGNWWKIMSGSDLNMLSIVHYGSALHIWYFVITGRKTTSSCNNLKLPRVDLKIRKWHRKLIYKKARWYEAMRASRTPKDCQVATRRLKVAFLSQISPEPIKKGRSEWADPFRRAHTKEKNNNTNISLLENHTFSFPIHDVDRISIKKRYSENPAI